MSAGAGELRSALARAAGAASQNATASGYLAGWRLVRRLPEPAARAVFDRVADVVYSRGGRGVERLRGNLAVARPGLDGAALEALTREAVRSYMRYWCESFRLPAWPVQDLVRRTRTVGERRFRDLYAEGHGVVAALPHLANWDWAGAWACANDMPVTTVAERLEPERLYDGFVDYRASLGMEILPAGDGGTFSSLTNRVRHGHLVCLLADRDLTRGGVEVALFGRTAKMPRGPAELARRTGAPLVPVTLAYVGPDLVVTFHPPVVHEPGEEGLATMTQQVADRFAEGIAAHPQDWHMMQRVFTDDVRRPRA